MKKILITHQPPQIREKLQRVSPASNIPIEKPSFRKKSRPAVLSDDVVSYYQKLLDEHNRFIHKNSNNQYRIL
jgi:hypothetical protein